MLWCVLFCVSFRTLVCAVVVVCGVCRYCPLTLGETIQSMEKRSKSPKGFDQGVRASRRLLHASHSYLLHNNFFHANHYCNCASSWTCLSENLSFLQSICESSKMCIKYLINQQHSNIRLYCLILIFIFILISIFIFCVQVVTQQFDPFGATLWKF